MNEVCIPNIGPRGRRMRMTFGFVVFGASVAIAAALFVLGAPRGARLLLFAPLWIAALGVLQAREKT